MHHFIAVATRRFASHALGALLMVGALGACTHVPTIAEPPPGQVAGQVKVTGARGPLSQRETDALLKRLIAQAPDAGALERHMAIEQAVAGAPLYTGNRVNILRDGDQVFDATFAAIHAARQYLYLEYYTLEEIQHDGEQLSDVLIAKQQAGVHIDVIYDSVGSISTPGAFFDRLAAAGIQVQRFNPIVPLTPHFSINNRDHRKLLLADGQLAPRYYATLLSAIRSAGTRIDVTAAYFAPTHQEQRALIHAVRRGVQVRLLLPSHSDSFPALAVQRSHYAGLLRGGVKIFERDDGILHSKTVVMDGVWSFVGSSNFDHRSILFNDEVDAVVIGSQTGDQMQQFFDQDLQHAQPIDQQSWSRRPISERLRERFWRLWEQLL
jgi:phosphatidylserine/phosphatidylglycerophosphate/cardiolipin synthase-like enzyme